MTYWQSALDWIETGGFNYIKESQDGAFIVPIYERTPGYSVFLLGVRSIFGASVDSVIIIQCILDSLTCVFAFLIGRYYSDLVGVVAGALAALQPNMIFHSAYILTDTLFLLLATLTIWSLCAFWVSRRMTYVGIAGLVLGASIAVRPVAQFAPPLLLVVLLLANHRLGLSILRNLSLCVVFVAGISVATAPLILRNLEYFESPRIVAQSGAHLMNWVLPLVVSFNGSKSYTDAAGQFNSSYKKEIGKRGYDYDSMNPFLRDNMIVALSLRDLSNIPPLETAAAWISGMAVSWGAPAIVVEKRVRSLKSDSFLELTGSTFDRIATMLFNTTPYASIVLAASVLAVLSIFLNLMGIRALAMERPLICFLAIAVILYFALLTGPVMSPKYRLPTEPIMAILSAIAIARIWDWIQIRVRFDRTDAMR